MCRILSYRTMTSITQSCAQITWKSTLLLICTESLSLLHFLLLKMRFMHSRCKNRLSNSKQQCPWSLRKLKNSRSRQMTMNQHLWRLMTLKVMPHSLPLTNKSPLIPGIISLMSLIVSAASMKASSKDKNRQLRAELLLIQRKVL